MVKEFIKPVNKERKLWNYLHHYLVKPPLVYHRDTMPEEPPVLAQAEAVAPSDGAKVVEHSALVASGNTKAPEGAVSDKRPRLRLPTKPQAKPYKEKPYKINFSALFKRAFILTYGVEGFEHTTSKTVFAENISGPRRLQDSYHSESFGVGLLIASFFGLPTRTKQTAAAGQEPKLSFTFLQFLKNMVGGWDNLYEEVQNPNAHSIELTSLDTINKSETSPSLTASVEENHDFQASSAPAEQTTDADNSPLAASPSVEVDGEESNAPNKKSWKLVWSEKKIWQIVLFFPFKFPIIFAFKLIGIVFKTALNIIKLFTEYLPQILTNIIATVFFNATEKLRFIASKNITPFNKFVQLLGFGLITVTLGVVNYTSRILTLILRAATSPEKSARMAYAAGREYNFESRSPEEFETFSKVLGFLMAAVSISISIVTWTLALPLVIGALMTYLPIYLPSVFQTLSTVTQLPIMAKALTFLNSALTPVANTLLNAAGPALSTLSTFLGVQISSLALILGTAIGALAAPLSAIGSRIADELSNAWTALHEKGHGPLNFIGNLFSRMGLAIKNWRNPPDTTLHALGETEEDPQQISPTKKAKKTSLLLVSETTQALETSQDAAHSTDRQLEAIQGAESDRYNFEFCGNSPDFQLLVTAARSSNNKAKEAWALTDEYKLTEKVRIEGFHFEYQFTAELQECLTRKEAIVPEDKRDNNTRLTAILAAIKELVAQKKRETNTTLIADKLRKL